MFIQFEQRQRQEQIEHFLTYNIYPLDIPKDLGKSKGILENPYLKIELTRANAFKVTTFGEYLSLKRKGRQPIVAKGKKKKQDSIRKKRNVIEIGDDDDEDDESEESEESEENGSDEESEAEEKQPSKKKRGEQYNIETDKLDQIRKDYLGSVNLKASPLKTTVQRTSWEKTSPAKLTNKAKNAEESNITVETKKNDEEEKFAAFEQRMTNKFELIFQKVLENQQSNQSVAMKQDKETVDEHADTPSDEKK
jgi:hypothetical protein